MIEKYTQNDLRKAHDYSKNNRKELEQDTLCGCFYCSEIFTPDKITEWIKDTEGTACCPFCGIDAVIGKYTGFPITPVFLGEMKKVWF